MSAQFRKDGITVTRWFDGHSLFYNIHPPDVAGVDLLTLIDLLEEARRSADPTICAWSIWCE
jgi:hypothetical protein